MAENEVKAEAPQDEAGEKKGFSPKAWLNGISAKLVHDIQNAKEGQPDKRVGVNLGDGNIWNFSTFAERIHENQKGGMNIALDPDRSYSVYRYEEGVRQSRNMTGTEIVDEHIASIEAYKSAQAEAAAVIGGADGIDAKAWQDLDAANNQAPAPEKAAEAPAAAAPATPEVKAELDGADKDKGEAQAQNAVEDFGDLL